MIIDELLENLLRACTQPVVSPREAKKAMEDLLVWLNEHNSDENCRKVDLFVTLQMEVKDRRDGLPEDIGSLLFDMGAQLHDTHTAPWIAENFESTPRQLLDRVRRLPY